MMPGVDGAFRRVWLGVVAMTLILVLGTVGYVVLGYGFLDALYQTVATVTTVGYRHPATGAGKAFTIVVVLVGVSTALYTFGVLLESLVEGHVRDLLGRRRMERRIQDMHDHVIICGWGRVGRAIARAVHAAGTDVVVVDKDATRLEVVPYPTVHGEVGDDAVLEAAGIGRARVLVAALNTDADNLYVTVSGRAIKPDLFIIARARTESSEPKLMRAGADRVVNPQRIGGERMAAFALQPHVAEFLDVVMHDGSLEFRLEEVPVAPASPLAGRTLRDAHIRDRTGALVLAVRDGDGEFATNPPPETVIQAGSILIAVGTSEQVAALVAEAAVAE
ncbi:MAG: voltage-gated potassium channel [Acidimicrobiaceae bacterium]|nr:voltage-gated potassium channel [Acidimicrobiaceae bacterium]